MLTSNLSGNLTILLSALINWSFDDITFEQLSMADSSSIRRRIESRESDLKCVKKKVKVLKFHSCARLFTQSLKTQKKVIRRKYDYAIIPG